jgi:hypothetical protein
MTMGYIFILFSSIDFISTFDKIGPVSKE